MEGGRVCVCVYNSANILLINIKFKTIVLAYSGVHSESSTISKYSNQYFLLLYFIQYLGDL